MKSQNAVAAVKTTPKVVVGPSIAEDQRSKNAPAPEEIRQRAYEIDVERGGIHGFDVDDWLQAERELQEKYKDDEKGAKKN